MNSWIDPVITVVVALIPLSFAYWRWWDERRLARRTLVKAILAEIRRLLDVIWVHTEWWKERVEAGDTDYPLIPFTTEVYDEHVGDIGALADEDVVAQVVSFYGYVKYINRFQDTAKSCSERKDGNGKTIFDNAYLELLKKTLDKFNNNFDTIFSKYKIKVHPEK